MSWLTTAELRWPCGPPWSRRCDLPGLLLLRLDQAVRAKKLAGGHHPASSLCYTSLARHSACRDSEKQKSARPRTVIAGPALCSDSAPISDGVRTMSECLGF